MHIELKLAIAAEIPPATRSHIYIIYVHSCMNQCGKLREQRQICYLWLTTFSAGTKPFLEGEKGGMQEGVIWLDSQCAQAGCCAWIWPATVTYWGVCTCSLCIDSSPGHFTRLSSPSGPHILQILLKYIQTSCLEMLRQNHQYSTHPTDISWTLDKHRRETQAAESHILSQ